MTGHADSWLLVLVLPGDSPDAPPCRIVVGWCGPASDHVGGAVFNLDELLDPAALTTAPREPGWWLWEGRIESVSYAEDDRDLHWDGRWSPATLRDLKDAGLALPRPG